MNKHNLNWQLATNPFDVYVLDPFNAVKRVHAPLAPSLSNDQLPLPKGSPTQLVVVGRAKAMRRFMPQGGIR